MIKIPLLCSTGKETWGIFLEYIMSRYHLALHVIVRLKGSFLDEMPGKADWRAAGRDIA